MWNRIPAKPELSEEEFPTCHHFHEPSARNNRNFVLREPPGSRWRMAVQVERYLWDTPLGYGAKHFDGNAEWHTHTVG